MSKKRELIHVGLALLYLGPVHCIGKLEVDVLFVEMYVGIAEQYMIYILHESGMY